MNTVRSERTCAAPDRETLFRLAEKYGGSGPRYTSYPPANRFNEGFPLRMFTDALRASNEAFLPAPLSVYIHIPFCQQLCYYCGCNKIVTRKPEKLDDYLEKLHLEIGNVSRLFDPDRKVRQLHLGGGTPTYLDTRQLEELFSKLEHSFRLSSDADRDYSMEIDPRTLEKTGLAVLKQLGVNRVSLGVQDFDPAVQRAINRIQPERMTRELLAESRRLDFASTNVDLIYGLPLQTVQSFIATISRIIDCGPDRVSMYNYAHLPQMFPAQRQIRGSDLPAVKTRLEIHHVATDMLLDAGYVHIGMDHFARPGDSLVRALDDGTLQRNFQGYTTHGDCDLVGLGVSAISHFEGVFSQNHKRLSGYYRSLENDGFAVERGYAWNDDDRCRNWIIMSIMCRTCIDTGEFESHTGRGFHDYFGDEVAELETMAEDGLVELDIGQIRVTDLGRFFLRRIAMVFDREGANPGLGRVHSKLL